MIFWSIDSLGILVRKMKIEKGEKNVKKQKVIRYCCNEVVLLYIAFSVYESCAFLQEAVNVIAITLQTL